MTIRITDHLQAIRTEGARLADVAAAVDLDALVPTCPGWTMRDLLQHTGGVHRWATGYVETPRAQSWDVDLPEVVGSWPPDDDLVPWLARGVERLVGALERATDDTEIWTFLPATSPRAMWARRQAHETAIHRVDAESAAAAAGIGTVTGFAPTFAADGIDELLFGFMARPGKGPDVDGEITLAVRPDDLDRTWRITMGGGAIRTTGDTAPADCRISAPAWRLYAFLWNRLDAGHVRVAGDVGVLGVWQTTARIRWS